MKITIDTKEDSAEEIKRIVAFLNTFLDKEEAVSNSDIFENPEVPQENMFGGIFGANGDADKGEEVKEEPDVLTEKPKKDAKKLVKTDEPGQLEIFY